MAAIQQHGCLINGLPGPILSHIFSLLPASDCAKAACTQSLWRQLADDDLLWRGHCERDWLEGGKPATHDGLPCKSFKAMYGAYYRDFSRYGPLFQRAKRVLASLRSWTAKHIPEIAFSLAPGVTEVQLDAAELKLGLRLPPAMRVFYRLCNGQHLQADRAYEQAGVPFLLPSRFHGLFGGYSFYDHVVSVRLFPLHKLVASSAMGVPSLAPPANRGQVAFAGSFESFKRFFLNCNDGLVYVGTRDSRLGGQDLLCVPPDDGPAPTSTPASVRVPAGGAGPSSDDGPSNGAVQRDGLLRWLEEYARRLHSDLYSVRDLTDMEPSRGICIFPDRPPACTTAVTRGVQVRCSAVLVPEACTFMDSEDRYYFAYSVRMRLLPSDPDRIQRPYRQVQLRARHWVIRSGNEIIDEVRGEAVIGKYPVLKEGEDEFVYQSCTGQRSIRGSIEGEFRMVPGRLLSPQGEEFDVQVARFPLEVPAYIY